MDPKSLPPKNNWSQLNPQARNLSRSGEIRLGLVIMVLFLLAGCFGPTFLAIDFKHMSSGAPFLKPSAAHWLGTDGQGKDMFQLIILAFNSSLKLGLQVVGWALGAGLAYGLLAASLGGWPGRFFNWIIGVKVPSGLFALVLTGAACYYLEPGIGPIIMALTIVQIFTFAVPGRLLALRLMGRIDCPYFLIFGSFVGLIASTLALVIVVTSLLSWVGLMSPLVNFNLGIMAGQGFKYLPPHYWPLLCPLLFIFISFYAGHLTSQAADI